jgi:hypothetical protein
MGWNFMDKSTSKRVLRGARQLLAVIAVIGLVLAVTNSASAVFPHYKRAVVTLVEDSALRTSAARAAGDATALPDVLFTFTLVGAGSEGGTFDARVGKATATFGCVNNGSNRPKATNKTSVSQPLEAFATFGSDAKGNISGSIRLETDVLFPEGFSCPPGQTSTAIELSLEDISLTEIQSGAKVEFDPIRETLWP